ncbi:telomere length regulation protein [Pichia californica]|uniref:Small ribosomal subunit protein mS41 n=1 Tax=Pichia californica TaxID=460514 RepID=A0A9P7BI71_9ASCO|nr:telomere length regulation protein [[Candida] californica]KAG0690468.1 telomere length regulation protein [[Candida] californica]
MFSRRLFSTSAGVLKQSPLSKTIPKPTKEITDVASFLQHIGRNTTEFSEAFPTWDALFTSTSKEMKAAGIDVKPRKYILEQVENYRKTASLSNNDSTSILNATKEIKLHPKKNGGERKLNKYLAQKRILERIEIAKIQKQYRKAQHATELKYKQLDKLHLQNNDTL